MKKILTYSIAVCIGLLLIYSGYLALDLINQSKVIQQEETDRASIHKIDYGLFNMDAWKDKALNIFTKRLQEFEISSDAYGEVEIELRSYLKGIYKDYFISGKLFEELFKEAEEKKSIPPLLLNMFKKNLPEQIGNLNIEASIPSMAKRLAGELRKKEPKIKAVLKSELDNILVDTKDSTVVDTRIEMAHTYGTNTIEELNNMLVTNIAKHKADLKQASFNLLLFLGAGLLLAFMLFFLSNSLSLLIASLTLLSIILLICGINLPMIILDVRLNAFSFTLFGQPLSFEEQTLFFQTKSILDVTQNLLEGRTFDLKIVGIMVLCFSVVFPVIKLILSGMYLILPKMQQNKLVKGMIFHLGKWSMADVFVVALFMAYVGFYGLITTQLERMENNKSGFAVETLNYTHLDYGAIFFTLYCILSISIGVILSKKQKSI